MSLHFYKIHPEHNLGGENYPHFRDYNDKKQYVLKKLIDKDKKLKLHISKISYDSARLTVNLSKYLIDRSANTISGLVTFFNTSDEQYWFVVGWSFGSNKNVVIYELQLDYWLTYWPLKFNKALVRVNRKHMSRFTKNSTRQSFSLRFDHFNRQLQIPEKTAPPAIFENTNWTIKYSPKTKLQLMLGIVFNSIGGQDHYFSDKNYLVSLGVNLPGQQNGFIIFAKSTNTNINSWLSLPGISHSFYFLLNTEDINNFDPHVSTWDVPEPPVVNDYRGIYKAELISSQKIDFKNKLQCVSITKEFITLSDNNYKEVASLITKLVYLSYHYSTKIKKSLDVLQIQNDYKVRYYLGSNYSLKINALQLLSLKSFFRNNLAKIDDTKQYVADQVIRGYTNIYFTTLNAFNDYMVFVNTKHKKNYLTIKDDFDFLFKWSDMHIKEPVRWERKLKMYTHIEYYIGLQTETQKYIPHLFDRNYYFYFLATIENSYFVMEPDIGILRPPNKKYNFVVANKTKFSNYTDNSLQFYQKQGFQFKTGIDQAKFQLDWTKRYNQFSENKFYYDATVGAMTSIFNRTSAVGGFGGKFGNVPMKAGIGLGMGIGAIEAGTNIYFGYQGLKLQNEMREKQAFYGLKMLQSKQEDIFNNPTATNNINQTELSYRMISNNIMPYIFSLYPTKADFNAQAKLYHKYGNLNDQDEIVDLNNPLSRRCWNFWEIHNIEQAIIKDNLNHMAITFFNDLFNKGIRLWNVFNDEVVFNDYSLENWEAQML